MASMNPTAIHGKWLFGVALDVHTLSSTHLGTDAAGREQFRTERTDLGELLYRLKYRQDRTAIPGIVAAARTFLAQHRSKFDMIIPVPPSRERALQPVPELARALGIAMGKPVRFCVTPTRATQQIKTVEDPAQRQKLMHGLYRVDADVTRSRNVLLFDDLYRSGTTLNAITDLLYQKGGARSVRVLTVTRTRSNR